MLTDCEKPAKYEGFCSNHKHRRHWDDPFAPSRGGRERPKHGYRVRTIGGRGAVFVHRLVMEKLIGRQLHAFETVHHKNGIRDDNRPENLELWAVPQPYGQRVEDLVDWVIENYPERLPR